MNIIDRDSGVEIKGSLALIDANGKELSVSISDITDIAPSFNSLEDSNLLEFTKVILDSDGNESSSEDLIKGVNDGSVSALDVTFEATHSGGNANHVVYTSDSMEKDYETWTSPFKKPLIKNHDMHEEPIGRVVQSDYAQSEIVEDRDTINVTFRVSDKDAMAKFADSRYSTMSIGASCNNVICNICGKNILKDNSFKFCGHWRGEKYKDQVATWTTKDLVYKEGSVVNNPADAYAQVKKIRAIKSKGGGDMKDNQLTNNDDNILDNISIIDNIIDDGAKSNPVVEDGTSVSNSENAVEGDSVKDELDKANVKIKELEDENKELNEKIISLSDSLADGEKNIITLTDQAKALAKINKKLLLDMTKDLSDSDDIEEVIKEKSAKELSDMIKDLRAGKQVATSRTEPAATIQNPSAVLKDTNVVEDNTSTNKDGNSKPTRTMKDFEEIINKLF